MINQNFPEKVKLIEVGPRDGFQFESQIIPMDIKLEIISGLVDAGLKDVQVTSFVHPKIVPQMADAEELLNRIPKEEDVVYSGLVLNLRGVERAWRAGLKHIEISISASDTHSRKNASMSLKQAIEQAKEMILLAQKYQIYVRAGIQCAFGCVYEGEIPEDRILDIISSYMELGIDMLALSDTTGMANPVSIKKMMEKVIPKANHIPIVLHLHDTRGLGLANVVAAMECGIYHFDTALAGMGGCPFVKDAAGNIATEDTVYLMESMGIDTGLDISKISKCSKQLEAFLGKTLPGKMYRMSD